MRERMRRCLPAVAVLLGVAGCVPVSGQAPAPAVPAIPAERIPAPPASTVTLIWQPSHYDWDGAHYNLVPGRWVPRAGHGSLWQDGGWERSLGQWKWVPAHWL